MKTSIILNKKFIAAAAVVLVTLASSAANAATTLTAINPASSPFTFAGSNGAVTVTFSGATASHIWAGENPIASQSYEAVGSYIQTAFTPGAFVGNGYQVDSAASIMSGSVATFNSPVAYNYLAIHFGKHEMIFDFGSTGVAANTAFQIATSGKAAGLSNFRAYSTAIPTPPPIATPIPAAMWLFGSGLVGLLGFRKKSVQALPA